MTLFFFFFSCLLLLLVGTRQTPDVALTNTLNLGSKSIAVIGGGTLDLHGVPVIKRWTRLGVTAAVGSSVLVLSEPQYDWAIGNSVIVTTSTYNPWNSEIRTITNVSLDGRTLTLNAPLLNAHRSKTVDYSGVTGYVAGSGASAPPLDLSAEVGLLSSNILITSIDGVQTHSDGGEQFGVFVVVHGNSTARITHTQLRYCGQSGLDRACVRFQDMQPLTVNGTSSPNPSCLNYSSILYAMDSMVRIVEADSASSATAGVAVVGNVMYEAYDFSALWVSTTKNVIQDNLVGGLIKEMGSLRGAFTHQDLIAVFQVDDPDNLISGNVAFGSERAGFILAGPACSTASGPAALFKNNTSHSSLVSGWAGRVGGRAG